MPAWMSDYSQALMGRANQIAAEPAPLYSGPRIASATPDQNKAYDLTRANIGSYQPAVTQGTGMITSGANALDPSNINKYMNPYTQNVIDRAALEANRNYSEKILPQLQNIFTASGQYGSSRMAEEADRAGRDVTEGLQSQSLAALSDAYKQATTTAGQSGQLQMTGGQSMINAGNAMQGMGLKDAASLETIGKEQQAQNQGNLDLAYSDWQRQQQYPKEMTDWLSTLLGNQAANAPRTTNTTQTGPQAGATGSSSGLSDIASLLSSAKGIYDIFGSRDGGHVEYADGGAVDRGDKKFINSSGLPQMMAASATPQAPAMDANWFNTYGEGPEHQWAAPKNYSFDMTGLTSGQGDQIPAEQQSQNPGLVDYMKLAKNGKDAYDKYQEMFGDTGSTAGFSSIASPTLGATTGLGAATGVGAANTAAELGAGYSNAATNLGSQFGTSASEAGLEASSTQPGLGSSLGEMLGGNLGQGILGVLGLYQGYRTAQDTGEDLVNSGIGQVSSVLKPISNSEFYNSPWTWATDYLSPTNYAAGSTLDDGALTRTSTELTPLGGRFQSEKSALDAQLQALDAQGPSTRNTVRQIRDDFNKKWAASGLTPRDFGWAITQP